MRRRRAEREGMDGERQLFRSRDALAGGVCAGIADYFGVDPIVVRILTVILSLATSGLAAIAYLVLWMMLPKAPERPAPYEVTPQHVHSDTYGTIDCDRARSASETAAASAASTHPPMYGAYRGVGHVPPEPPASFPHGTAPASPGSAASTPPAPAASAPPAPAAPTPAGNPVHAGDPAHSGGAKAALVFGILLLFCGVLALVSKFIIGVAWWQFWPLALVIVGIVQMVVPGERGRRAKKFSGGLILFCMGASLLPISLGAFDCATIARTFANLWPLLVIMAGLFVMGGALFSMHFGASCMLYPMTWGKESGSAVYLAYAGVFLSGILITLLGYTALSRGNDSFWGLTKRIAPRFGTVLCSLVVLLVGPVYVIPRMSASAWDAILQLLGVESLGTLPVVLFNLVVYGIIFWFIAGKVKVTDRIGKILTPIQVLIVLAVVIKGVITPISATMAPPVYEEPAFVYGFSQAYATGDLLCALLFGAVLVGDLKKNGLEGNRLQKGLVSVGVVGLGILALIHLGQMVVGAHIGESIPLMYSALYAQAAIELWGQPGGILFAVALVTAVIHTVVAFPFVLKIMRMLNFSNETMFMAATGITIVVFAVVYVLVYAVTARSYYRIVEE